MSEVGEAYCFLRQDTKWSAYVPAKDIDPRAGLSLCSLCRETSSAVCVLFDDLFFVKFSKTFHNHAGIIIIMGFGSNSSSVRKYIIYYLSFGLQGELNVFVHL